VHGAALGAAEIEATRKALGWSSETFHVPHAVRAAWDARARGAEAQRAWEAKFAAYTAAFPAEAAEFTRRMAGALPADFAARADAWIADAAAATAPAATRKSSQIALEHVSKMLPELFGGSADLTGSNNTNWKACIDVNATGAGNYLHYGVREFAMSAMLNGIALHGGYIPFGGTFLVFSDYSRNALRLAALMKLRSIFVLSHDSIAVGEDGPTHQPVEHVTSLRLIPNMDVWRPCDTLETAAAWRSAAERKDGPTCLILTRQNLDQHPYGAGRGAQAARGGYIFLDCAGVPDIVLIATGSEIDLAIKAQTLLAAGNVAARIVSMPCTSIFARQPAAYRNDVLPPGIRRVAIEAGVTDFWYRYVGLEGAVIGIDSFGESAPGNQVFAHFGFTPEAIADKIRHLLT
jgi:transketolase